MWLNNRIEFEFWTVPNVTIDLALLSSNTITSSNNNAFMGYAFHQGKKHQ